jgi:dolichol-phosphate mannosyltransferase
LSAAGEGEKNVLSLQYWERFIKFNLVGLSGVVVNEGLLIILATLVYYVYASVVAIEVSIITNFIINDFWTFRDRRHGHIAARFFKFNGLMLIGLAVNLGILFAGTNYLSINYTLSNLIGIGAAFLVRYWLSLRYAWIKKEEQSVIPPKTNGPLSLAYFEVDRPAVEV